MSTMNRLKTFVVYFTVSTILGVTLGLSCPYDRQPGPMFGAAERSGHWPAVRAEHLRRHGVCEVCGTRDNLEVHHVLPFHDHPELELDPDNLITLCRRDHLVFGHLGSYLSHNPKVREDAAHWKKRFAERP